MLLLPVYCRDSVFVNKQTNIVDTSTSKYGQSALATILYSLVVLVSDVEGVGVLELSDIDSLDDEIISLDEDNG